MALPNRSWESYEAQLQEVAERRFGGAHEELRVLRELGMVDSLRALTDLGSRYYHARFLRGDETEAEAILHQTLLSYRPAEVIIQLLAGMPSVSRTRAESVLRYQGFGKGLSDREVGSLLMLMHRGGLIRYSKRHGTFEVIANPAQAEAIPKSVFISQETPFGNRVWLRRVLAEPEGFIYWLDKHFMPSALEVIWEATSGSRVSEIRVLSLKLPDNSGTTTLRDYRNLRKELAHRSVDFEWRFIESKLIRDTHDRWIIGRDQARNVPNVNAILSGQRSELNTSDQFADLKTIFEAYWDQATPIDTT